MVERRSAGVIVWDISQKEPRILILQYTAGHWGFPKGHIEAEETLLETALRELYEETGMQVTLTPTFVYRYRYCVQYPGLKEQLKEVTLFLAVLTVPVQTIKISHEHKDYIWLTYDKAYQCLTYQNTKEALTYTKRWIERKYKSNQR